MQPKDLYIPIVPDTPISASFKGGPTRQAIPIIDPVFSSLQRPPEPSAIDSLVGSLQKPDEFANLYAYSEKQIKPWRKGPSFNPYLDMEDAYAKADPFTMGDVFSRMWSEVKNNTGASYAMLGSGLNEISKGNWAGFWNNPYSKHLADLTEQLEELKPLYRTADERDNPLAFRNLTTTASIFLPALGTVGATLADVAIGKVIATGVGALAGPGGIIAANSASLLKDSFALRSAFSGIWSLAKGLQTGSKLSTNLARGSKISQLGTKGQALAAGMFYANGEAALQAELNSRKFLEDKQAQYYAQNGKWATGDQLKEMEEVAKEVGNMTYGLNLPLIAGTQMVQFGSLIVGKATRDIAANLPIALSKTGLKQAVVTSGTKFTLKEFGKDIGSEGFEEFAQSVIDNTASTYYKPLVEQRGGLGTFATTLAKETWKHGTTQEGVLDFLGGALIGGVISGGKGGVRLATGNTYKAQAQKVVDAFNSSTDTLVQQTLRSEYTANKMQEAFNTGDHQLVERLVSQSAFHMTQEGFYQGTLDARKEQLESFKELDITEFNEHFSVELTQEQRDLYIDQVVNSINKAEAIIEQVNNIYAANPFYKDDWFNNMIGYAKTKMGKETQDKELAMRVWQDFKAIVAYNAFQYDDMTTSLNGLKAYFGEEAYLLDSDIKKAVSTFATKARDRAIIDLSYQTFLDKIKDKPVKEQYEMIINFLGFQEQGFIKEALKTDISRRMLMDEARQFRSPQGQRELLEEITEYLEYTYGPTSITSERVAETETTAESQIDQVTEEELEAERELAEESRTPDTEPEQKVGINQVEENPVTPAPKRITQIQFDLLPFAEKMKQHQTGLEIKPDKGFIFYIKTPEGDFKGMLVKSTKDGFYMTAVPESASSLKGGEVIDITQHIQDLKQVSISTQSKPVQREELKQPPKKQEIKDTFDQYMKSLNYPKGSEEYKYELKQFPIMQAFINIQC